MEALLIGLLATALFSVIGLLGTQMNALRGDVQRQTEGIGEHLAASERNFGEVRNDIAEVRRDVAEIRGEVSDLRGEVREHLAQHA